MDKSPKTTRTTTPNVRTIEKTKIPTIEIRQCGECYIAPQKAKPGSIGFDLAVPDDIKIPAHSRVAIRLNFAINLPYLVEGKIEPRSGLSITGMEGYGVKRIRTKRFGFLPWYSTISGKQNFDADIIVSKLDPGYNGSVHVILKNNDVEFVIRKGTRVAQLTFYRTISPMFQQVKEFTMILDRGGGLGSSGTQHIATEVPNHCRVALNDSDSAKKGTFGLCRGSAGDYTQKELDRINCRQMFVKPKQNNNNDNPCGN